LTYSVIAPLILVLGAITFGLFGLVFRYHLLCVSVLRHDTGGQLYPTALKQLFTGVYVLELCLMGLFMTVRNTNDSIVGIGQLVLITLATIATITFHVTLEKSFAAVLRHLPAGRDGDYHGVDFNKESLAAQSPSQVLPGVRRLFHRLVALFSRQPLSSVSPSLRAGIHEFAKSQNQVQSQHVCKAMPALHRTPIIFIPRDSFGLTEEEVLLARKRLSNLQFSTELAKLDVNGHLVMSESADHIDDDWLDDI